MKKKTKIILACIAACIIVAAVAVVIKVNLDKQAKNKSLTEGKTAIETYLQSFDEENEEGKKAEIYTSFQSDEKITSVIEKYFQNKETKKEDWYQNYSKANKKMYQYFVDYFNDLISTESDNFENDKSIAACDTMIENLNNISDTLEQDAIIKSDDRDSIRKTKLSMWLHGAAGFPDFVVLERKKSRDARRYGCVEIKCPGKSNILRITKQVKGHIISYGRVIYTNGLQWKFYRVDKEPVKVIVLGRIDPDNQDSVIWEPVDNWYELMSFLEDWDWKS